MLSVGSYNNFSVNKQKALFKTFSSFCYLNSYYLVPINPLTAGEGGSAFPSRT